MTPKIKTAIIAVFVLLAVLSASIFAYSRISETQTAPSTSKNGTPKEKAGSESKPAASEPSTSVKGTSQVVSEPVLNTKLTEEPSNTPSLTKDTEQDAAETTGETVDSVAKTELVEEAKVVETVVIDTAERIDDTIDSTSTKEQDDDEDMDLNTAQVEENITEEVQDEIIIFGNDLKIVLYNLTNRQAIANYPGNYDDQFEFQNPKISPDGKLIAFYLSSSFIMERSGLFLMNSDGTNMRRLIESGSIIDDFDFGPKGDSVLYVFGNGYQVRQLFIDSDNSHSPELIRSSRDISFKRISCHKQYLYWVHEFYNAGFEICRKSMNLAFPESEEIVYTGETRDANVKYSVSPDGNHMIIAQNLTSSSRNQISILNLQTRVEIGPLRFAGGKVLKNLFWSLDGQWIYAERWTNPPELVRFKFDGLYSNLEEVIEWELVISGFTSHSVARFVPQAFDFKEFEAELRKVPIDAITDYHGPLNVSVGDFDETLVFSASSARATDSIVSFNTRTRALHDISGKITGLIENDGSRHFYPQVSSDGKLIAFIEQESIERNRFSPSLYLMNSDGSNSRKLADCRSFEALAFGPDDESILYIDSCRNLCQIALSGENEGRITEIENYYRGLERSTGIFNISVVNGHVYWHSFLENGFKIWRKNLLEDSAVPKLVYISVNGVHSRRLNSYIVSPDGKKLVVSEYAGLENYQGQSYLGIFDIPDEVVVDAKMPLIRGPATLRTDKRLCHMFWYTDAQGQDWVFAQNQSADAKGLVRCKVEEVPELNFEMVIPDFSASWGISLVPKN